MMNNYILCISSVAIVTWNSKICSTSQIYLKLQTNFSLLLKDRCKMQKKRELIIDLSNTCIFLLHFLATILDYFYLLPLRSSLATRPYQTLTTKPCAHSKETLMSHSVCHIIGMGYRVSMVTCIAHCEHVTIV